MDVDYKIVIVNGIKVQDMKRNTSTVMIRMIQNQKCWIIFPALQTQILFHFQFECFKYESGMSALLQKRWINLFCCIRRDSANDM